MCQDIITLSACVNRHTTISQVEFPVFTLGYMHVHVDF